MVWTLAFCLARFAAARSPSHDSGSRRAFSAEGFSAPPLPGPLAGLERLAARGNCVSKAGLPLCRRNLGSSTERGRSPLSTGNDHNNKRRGRSLSARKASNTASATRSAPAPFSAPSSSFNVVQERVAWQSKYGGLAVFERFVEMPSGGSSGGGSTGGGMREVAASSKLVEWHVTGSPLANFSSVVVFPYDTRTQSCTLIREYCPGSNMMLSGLPGGMFEPEKHTSLLHAARDELNEEAELTGGTWVELAPAGIPQDKYSRNRLHVYLAIDCSIDPSPRPRDQEEHITVEHGVHVDEVLRRITAGDMVAPGAVAALLAVEKLRQMGLR